MERLFETLQQTVERLAAYSPVVVAVELAVIWTVLYFVWRFVRGTRAAGAIKGVLLLVGLTLALGVVISPNTVFERIEFFYDKVLAFAVLALVIIFQPELRRGMIRLGEASFLRLGAADHSKVLESVVASCQFLSKNKFGAIIAIEQRVGLRELVERGTPLDAAVSAELLQSIFWPNNPLHDMGVVVRGSRVVAAGVQFPLTDPAEMRDQRLGTRHRAATGLSRVSDAVIVVVSEETGAISIAHHGTLSRWIAGDQLLNELRSRLSIVVHEEDATRTDKENKV